MKVMFNKRDVGGTRFRALLAAWVAAAVCFFASPSARADQGDAPDVEAQRLAHLMSYVAADYGGAVKDGAVTSQSEYEEQRALLREAGSIAKRLDDASKPHPIDTKLSDLVAAVAEKVDAKADEKEVGARAVKARTVAL